MCKVSRGLFFFSAKVSFQTNHHVSRLRFLGLCIFAEIPACRLAPDFETHWWGTVQSGALTNKRAVTLVHFLDDGSPVCFSKTFTLIPMIQIAFFRRLIHPKNVQASDRKSTISKSGDERCSPAKVDLAGCAFLLSIPSFYPAKQSLSPLLPSFS